MANEIQLVTLSASPQHGSYKLTFESEETGSIAYDANAAAIQAALEALTTIGSGNVSVAVDGLVITIEFVGELANTDVSAITVTANTMGRNTVETLSVSAAPATGNLSCKETAFGGSSGLIDWGGTAELAENMLRSKGYPSATENGSLVVTGNWYPTGFTLTSPADVTLYREGDGSLQDSESSPLLTSYAKTQAYSAVTATPSTEQDGSEPPAPSESSSGSLTLMGVG